MSLWSESPNVRAAPFATAPKGLVHLEAVERLKDLTRSRFDLGDSDAVMVSETACEVPGGPPLQTVVAFWTAGERHRFRVFKGVDAVTEEDIPPAWLKASLAAADAIACACC
jgi:hypothetical protein